MDSTSPSSKALVRKRSETDLMPPPPPVKKLKRPKQVLNEEDYTNTLSHIIVRDFFPGIKVSAVQHEYLDACESRDAAWISNARQRLHDVLTPRRPRSHSTPKPSQDNGRTPTTFVGDTPSSAAPTMIDEKPPPGINMGLSRFQSKYTSEDNESFYKLLDKQNQKKAEKHAWMWNNNKLPSKQMIKQKEVMDRLKKQRSLVDDGFKRDRLAILDVDNRPARPDSWKAAPRNGLMFQPSGLDEGVATVAQKADESSRMGPRAIVYENTRIPQPHIPQRPLSPTMSAIRDAAAGRPRRQDRDSSDVGGGETPRVNGYTYVDDEDDEPSTAQSSPAIDLGPGDAHNPFKLQELRKRESLHERLVERIAKSNKESSRHGLAGKAEKGQVPKFPSSPRISGNFTPAAQRLLSKMGTPRSKTPSTSFGQSTPMKLRGSLLKSVTKPSSKQG
ncbi:nuclear protein es2 domain-containing protein [Hirsutella rhossiliensis]|uniref:Nuclear protein es2 domain-containing protein n=1 Tax=Hirsutella rhossiliensis TaxID=111463 RepID=A0A9P8MYW1_9HYPO|nr:nuclear protein es2 domain-containing protein [Hirsutella rhossiliensis]KAH0964943.1 nuclear protein es2 domain-containing protein [Hirsutella rhossiliensis]